MNKCLIYNEPTEEVEVRFFMKKFIEVFTLWKEETKLCDAAAVIWQYFYKHLNNHLILPDVTIV